MTTKERIDICIPCLNGEKVIEDTIRSCNSSHPVRIIVGLNACTDGTKRRLESLGLDNLIIKDFTSRVDMVENWVRTLKLCDSEYVKLLPAGDKLLPGALDHQLKVLTSGDNTDNVGLVASQKAISHKSSIVGWLVNRVLEQNNGRARSRSTGEVLNELEKLPRNIFGEPGCVLFKQSALRCLLRSDESFIRLGRLYPYVVDLIMYIEAIRSAPDFTDCIFDTRTVCSFEVSRRSGTWKLRRRQYSDLLGYCKYLGLRPGLKAKIVAKSISMARELVYLFA